MLNRLVNIFKSESERTQLLVIVVIAVVIQVVLIGFREAIITTLIQLIVAGIVGFVFAKYINKTSNTTRVGFTKGFFILISLFSIIKQIFF